MLLRREVKMSDERTKATNDSGVFTIAESSRNLIFWDSSSMSVSPDLDVESKGGMYVLEWMKDLPLGRVQFAQYPRYVPYRGSAFSDYVPYLDYPGVPNVHAILHQVYGNIPSSSVGKSDSSIAVFLKNSPHLGGFKYTGSATSPDVAEAVVGTAALFTGSPLGVLLHDSLEYGDRLLVWRRRLLILYLLASSCIQANRLAGR